MTILELMKRFFYLPCYLRICQSKCTPLYKVSAMRSLGKVNTWSVKESVSWFFVKLNDFPFLSHLVPCACSSHNPCQSPLNILVNSLLPQLIVDLCQGKEHKGSIVYYFVCSISQLWLKLISLCSGVTPGSV